MPLIRTTSRNGTTVMFSIPSQIAQACDIARGDDLEIILLGEGEFKVRKKVDKPGGA
jgi:bifunctional DNA-binding transcriptional regulator/antitoxin component of YhaV-PrlF toxin-antitoxin module